MYSNNLTDARRIEIINEATQTWGRKDNDLLYLEVCKAIERELAASPVEQPAPSPSDEQAALSEQDIYDKFSFLEGLVNESTYVQIADTAIEIARAGYKS
ncbi:TPA: hypothetical protein QDA98_003896 [Burkholderia vietnamiensis]|nr:hypothetical protein [Burkholderia vietnamiensis]